VKLSALRMRRDVLVGLEEAAQLDILPIAGSTEEAVTPEVAKRFAAAFAESERLLASASETGIS
jgi:plasmid stabilization system protein ParE